MRLNAASITESRAFIFSKRPNLSHWIVWCEIRFEHQKSTLNLIEREREREKVGAYVLADHFNIGLQAISQKKLKMYTLWHAQTHTYLMDYQFPFIHSFMCSQTMNLMSRFNHERRRKKMKPEKEKQKNSKPNRKRRHFISLSSHLEYLFAVFVHNVCMKILQKTVPHAVIFSVKTFLLVVFHTLCVHVCLIDTYKLKTERASMLKSKHE